MTWFLCLEITGFLIGFFALLRMVGISTLYHSGDDEEFRRKNSFNITNRLIYEILWMIFGFLLIVSIRIIDILSEISSKL